MVAARNLSRASRAVAFSQDGSLIAVGYHDGSVDVFLTEAVRRRI